MLSYKQKHCALNKYKLLVSKLKVIHEFWPNIILGLLFYTPQKIFPCVITYDFAAV